MFLKKANNKKTGRTYLSIVHGYRDKTTKKTKLKTIESLGYLDELEKTYADPIAFFQEKVCQMNAEQAVEKAQLTFQIGRDERIQSGTTNRKNLGYAVLSQIYHELGLHIFLKNRQRHTPETYDANAIMKLLVFSRLLYPASKKGTYDQRTRFFEKMTFSLDDLYRCLSFLAQRKDALQLFLHEQIKQRDGRRTDLVYYDVTHYYFESDRTDDLWKKGVSKEHRPNPIIQMGLFMDTEGIPITYGLYPGNQLDKQTFIPMLREIQRKFSLGRTLIVADKGMTTGDNIWYTLSAKNGYILSYSVRGADQTFKDYVLDPDGYRLSGDGFKIKSRLYPRTLTVTAQNGKKIKKRVDEKQVVFYSEKYARKARADRAPALEKARQLIQTPSRYTRATLGGAAKYVKNLSFDPKTGEIKEPVQKVLLFDDEKLKHEEALDGYYAIVTSEYAEADEKIIDLYRGLWKIEENFKVTKSDLETRPVYLSTRDHIEAHFLICFVSLVLARLLERRLGGVYSIPTLIDRLKKASCSHIQENYYLFDYEDEVLTAIGEAFGIDFGKKCRSLQAIKKILGAAKKS